jgi:hypothetical protein
VRWDGYEQVVSLDLALLEPHYPLRRVNGSQGMERPEADLLAFEHLYNRRAQLRSSHGHRLRFGGEELNVNAGPALISAEIVGDQHGPFVRRARALVWHRGYHNRDAAAGEARQGIVEARGALKCVERLRSFRQTRKDIGRQLRADGYDEVIERDFAGTREHFPLRQVQRFRVGMKAFNPSTQQICHGAAYLMGFSIAGHQPEKRRRERVHRVAFHKHDAVVRGKALPQPIGGDHPADATAEDHDSL